MTIKALGYLTVWFKVAIIQ